MACTQLSHLTSLGRISSFLQMWKPLRAFSTPTNIFQSMKGTVSFAYIKNFPSDRNYHWESFSSHNNIAHRGSVSPSQSRPLFAQQPKPQRRHRSCKRFIKLHIFRASSEFICLSLEDVLRVTYFIQHFKCKCFHGSAAEFFSSLYCQWARCIHCGTVIDPDELLTKRTRNW